MWHQHIRINYASKGFLFATVMYRLIFIQKARIKYIISGDPMVRKET